MSQASFRVDDRREERYEVPFVRRILVPSAVGGLRPVARASFIDYARVHRSMANRNDDSFLSWLLQCSPARVKKSRGRVDLFHDDGRVSTLWTRGGAGRNPHPSLEALPFYRDFDAAALFDRALVLASLTSPRTIHGKIAVVTVTQLVTDAAKLKLWFAVDETPFMRSADHIFVLDKGSGSFVGYSTREKSETERYETVEQLIESEMERT